MTTILLLYEEDKCPHGDELGLMNFLSVNSLSYFLTSSSSTGAIRCGCLDIGMVLGISSMANSISHFRGSPGNSSGKTSRNSSTTDGISSSEVTAMAKTGLVILLLS